MNCTDRCRRAASGCWNPDRDIRRIHNALTRMHGNQIAYDLGRQTDAQAHLFQAPGGRR